MRDKEIKKDKEILTVTKLVFAQNTRRPRRRIEIQFSMVGGLQAVVLIFKFDQSWLSSSRDVRGQNLAYCITLANGLYNRVLPYRCDDGSNVLNVSTHRRPVTRHRR